MHQIVIEYKPDFDWRLLEELRNKLATLGSALFYEDRLTPIAKDAFDFKFERVQHPSTSNTDVVVRVHLPEYECRVDRGAYHALLVKALIINILDNEGYYLDGAGPSVGVWLNYSSVATKRGTLSDMNSRHLNEVERLLDGVRYSLGH